LSATVGPSRRSLIGAVAVAAALAAVMCATAAHASELLVKFQPRVGRTQVQHTIAALGARQVKAIPDLGVRVISVRAGASHRVLASLLANPGVRYVEADAIARPQETVPDDPFFPAGSLALEGGAWGWYQTHTTQAWDVTQGDPSVVIAILDTGLKPQGLDFGGQVVSGWNVLNDTTDTSSQAGNHGTHVAGAAGLAIDSASGNAGYCPHCRIMPVQVGTDSGASDSNMAIGITWAADHGARVENLSWAGTSPAAVLTEAVSYARSKGVVVFAAAGNSNCNCITYPAHTPGVLGVAGLENSGAKSGDSNYGSWVALAAPEGNMTASPSIDGAPGYGPDGGTSLATPAAAGIAGLVLSADPALSGAQVEQVLERSAAPAPFTVAYGKVDAMAALSSIGLLDPQAAGPPLNVIAPEVLVETNSEFNNASLASSPQVGQVLVRGQGAWRGSSPLSLSRVDWDRCNQEGTACTSVGSSSTYTVQSADAGSTLRLRVTFADPDGSTSAASAPSGVVGGSAGTVSAPVNTAPPVVSGTAQAGQTLVASIGSWSGSPTSFAYQWQRCDTAGGSCTAIAGAMSSSYAAGSADVGYTIRVAVTAANAGGSATAVSSATEVITATPASAQTLTFSGSLSSKHPTASFSVAVGAGLSEAQLSFSSKCPPLALALASGVGQPLASSSGPSVLALNQLLAAGSYSYVVSGSTRCSFTLVVSSPAP
jgi:subtilisin family serine protease